MQGKIPAKIDTQTTNIEVKGEQMLLDISKFMLFYLKISDNLNIDQDEFYLDWESMLKSMPKFYSMSYYRDEVTGELLNSLDCSIKNMNAKNIDKCAKKNNLQLESSELDTIEQVKNKILTLAQMLIKKDIHIGDDNLKKIIDENIFEDKPLPTSEKELHALKMADDRNHFAIKAFDATRTIYQTIVWLKTPIELITRNRQHIINLFSGRSIRLINGDFDVKNTKRIIEKNLGFKFAKFTNAGLICNLIEAITNLESTGPNPTQSTYLKGIDFELQISKIYQAIGYDVAMTNVTGDFGVDIIVKSNLEKIGIQCKNLSSNVGVDAIMQVHSGGKFYDCTRCCVITTQGFTDAAVEMANKLGVEILIHRKI